MKEARIRIALICVIFGLALTLLFSTRTLAGTIREVHSGSDKLIPVHTALGFSTILEFQTKPTSAVIGDQDAYKLEYVGNSITLKPLIQSSKSNLFVYTEFERFNFLIQTGLSSNVDFIVRIRPEKEPEKQTSSKKPEEPYRNIEVNQKKSLSGYTLKVIRLKLARDHEDPRAASLIEFELGSSKNTYDFQSASIGIKQNGKFMGVESLFLESTEVSPKSRPIRGVIAVLNSEWNQKLPITLVFATLSEGIKKKTERLQVTVNPTPQTTKRKETKNGKMELFPKLRK